MQLSIPLLKWLRLITTYYPTPVSFVTPIIGKKCKCQKKPVHMLWQQSDEHINTE